MPNIVPALLKLRNLLTREAPAQADQIRDALRQTAQTGKEHSVVGLADRGKPSSITRGTTDAVTPDSGDVFNAVYGPNDAPIVDFHTHPDHAMSLFGIAPSQPDLKFYASQYPIPMSRELRTIIASPPSRTPGDRRGAAFSAFSTDRPRLVFDPRKGDAARYELQRAASKGAFKALQDDPAMRDYFDYGGDLADMVGDASPLALLRYYADKGYGRQALQLSGRQLTPHPDATDARALQIIQGPALDVLRDKKFARGGLATMKECSCHG